jgi:hypothetical protein
MTYYPGAILAVVMLCQWSSSFLWGLFLYSRFSSLGSAESYLALGT